jgi:hypothetical protein
MWMEEILHQLIGGLSHFFGVSTIQSGAGFLPSTACGNVLLQYNIIYLY